MNFEFGIKTKVLVLVYLTYITMKSVWITTVKLLVS